MQPKFFPTQKHFRQWLEKNHDRVTELVVGFHKKSAGRKSITYAQALDEALCFGWIDGVRKRLEDTSYTIRFTPRKPRSIWSLINVRHVERLKESGQMHESGLRVFNMRDEKRTGIYSFENEPKEFSKEYLSRFQRNPKAWDFFKTQPPGYRRLMTFWVMSAKKNETQLRRLNQLIEHSEQGIRERVMSSKQSKDSKTPS